MGHTVTRQHLRPSERAREAGTPRAGVALCLSGGGYRAALFHLGAVRRLNELGVLAAVDTISAVSGGSILAAHLVDRLRPWPERGAIIPTRDWERDVAAPFRAFAGRDIRTEPVLRGLALGVPRGILGGVLRGPFRGLRTPRVESWSTVQVEALAAQFGAHLTRLRLADLPERPKVLFCATDMRHGDVWVFGRETVGRPPDGDLPTPADWDVARAVAASACFPPVFGPMELRVPPADRTVQLTDGGVCDNMGLEPVWVNHETVLVSDGGGPFEFRASGTPWSRLTRYAEIQGAQSWAVRKRWLLSDFRLGEAGADALRGTYWGIRSVASPVHYAAAPPQAYPQGLVYEFIAPIRTDLDRFSEGEAGVLENHGYLLAEAAVRTWVPDLVDETQAQPLQIPHPEWLSHEDGFRAAREALEESHLRSSPLRPGLARRRRASRRTSLISNSPK